MLLREHWGSAGHLVSARHTPGRGSSALGRRESRSSERLSRLPRAHSEPARPEFWVPAVPLLPAGVTSHIVRG